MREYVVIEINPSIIPTAELATLAEDVADSGTVKRQGQTDSGEKVSLREIKSPLLAAQEALEEVSAEVGEKMARFRLLNNAKTGRQDRYNKFEKIKKMLQMVPDLSPQDQLLDLPDQIREYLQENPEANAQDLISFLKNTLKMEDPTHLYVTLKYIEDVYKDRAEDAPLLRLATSAVASLVETYGPDIKAGINVTIEAVSAAESGKIGDTQSLRDDYRELIQFKEFASTLTFMLDKYEDNFELGHEYLSRAVSADMMSTQSSTSPVKLELIRDGLHQMASVNTILKTAEGLMARVQTKVNEIEAAPTA